MSTNQQVVKFQSVIAPLLHQFIQEKRACGYNYQPAPRILKELDNFLCNAPLKQIMLPKKLILQWLAKRSNEQASTQQRRISLVRQLAQFMVRLGYSAYIVPGHFGTPRSNRFAPYIFTPKEIRKFIHAVDQLKPNAISPIRYLVMPEIFRLLYGCGFRVMEVLNLRVGDVDLERGVITVRNAKFGKDRLVPPAPDIVKRLRIYTKRLEKVWLEKRTDDAFFFPSAPQTAWSHSGIYTLFRKLLYKCGISHRGRGKGPRLHDIRHTFAVHKMVQWHKEGADLNAKLPLLIAYLGHQDFTGTQKYLHLTAELFPNLTARMNKQFGGVIPTWR